jgi:ABC-2 type transport system ATP-binding protein
MSNILEVRGLCKDYGTFKLRDVSFGLPRGYIMGFVGPNGAGKTTTIKLILDVIKADAGSVRVFNAADRPEKVNAVGERETENAERIGVVMDAPMYVEDWTLTDVEKAVAPFYTRWDAGTYKRLLAKFGLDAKKKVKELSRGMKVKLQIAVAFSHDASLLILDEPTSGLDPVARDEICDLLREFVIDESHSVLFSTHITSDLEKVADYITFILDGRIIFYGSKDDLLAKYSLVKGGLNEITAEQKKQIIGLREHRTGFEGMIETADIRKFPRGLMYEEITLDEIIIFMNKGARLHE